jgi:DNA-binding response OmpR family regulator
MGLDATRGLSGPPWHGGHERLSASKIIFSHRWAPTGIGGNGVDGKPFDFAELVARVRALARRPSTPLAPTLECGDVALDCGRRVAFRAGRRLELSPKELAVLECLLSSQDRALSAEELLERAWDEYTDPFTTAVKTTIRRLRAKLGDPPMIHTVREAGYRIGTE